MADALYGDVLLCKNTSGNKVAVKRMDWDCATRKTTQKGSNAILEDAALEWKVNKVLSAHGGHQNVLRMQDSFEEDDKLHLVFDFCSKGELFGIVQQQETLSERRALRYAHQILLGLRHMHRNGVAHRDLSLENVLVNDNDECQICDFGLVASIPSMRSECVGKTLYMAPEVVACMPYNPTKADSWSLGVILFILLTGVPPFDEACPQDRCFQVAMKHGVERLVRMWRLESTMSSETMDLLTKLLKINPNERCTVAAALSHPAFKGTQMEMAHAQKEQAIVASFREECPAAESHTMNIRSPELCYVSPASKTMPKFVAFFKRKQKKPTTSSCRSAIAKSGHEYISAAAGI